LTFHILELRRATYRKQSFSYEWNSLPDYLWDTYISVFRS